MVTARSVRMIVGFISAFLILTSVVAICTDEIDCSPDDLSSFANWGYRRGASDPFGTSGQLTLSVHDSAQRGTDGATEVVRTQGNREDISLYRFGGFEATMQGATCNPGEQVVSGFFTFSQEEYDGEWGDAYLNGQQDSSEIDIELLGHDPQVVYLAIWTAKDPSSEWVDKTTNGQGESSGTSPYSKSRVQRAYNLVTREVWESESRSSNNLVKTDELGPFIPNFDHTENLYTYGFEWGETFVEFWIEIPGNFGRLTLWRYDDPSGATIPQRSAELLANVWIPVDWNGIYPSAAEPECNLHWMTFTIDSVCLSPSTQDQEQLPGAKIDISGDLIVGEEVQFLSTRSRDDKGNLPNKSIWEWSDGFSAEGLRTARIHDEPGTYLVTLTVFDDEGRENSRETEYRILSESYTKQEFIFEEVLGMDDVSEFGDNMFDDDDLLIYNESPTWFHSFPSDADGILNAQLSIRAGEVDFCWEKNGNCEWDYVYVNDVEVGWLLGQNETWHTTTFDIPNPDVVFAGGKAKIFIHVDYYHTPAHNWGVVINESTLTITYWKWVKD